MLSISGGSTVRKAFIGYDCKMITVVGVLTNYRDMGHLMQLVGRGLRTWRRSRARNLALWLVGRPGRKQFVGSCAASLSRACEA
jgi:hypothetical protein